jgi:nucleotide-binding universal stress UspA family protein
LTDADRERFMTELRQFSDRGRTSDVQIQTMLREGDTVAAILNVAESVKADLVAVGTHGRSGFERLLLGSVTEKLLRKACCPVLTVPRGDPDSAPADAGLFKRILCPIDFSECSMAALQYAMSMAQENDAELVVFYVVPNDLVPLPGQSPSDNVDPTISVAEFFIRREAHVRQLLQEAVPAPVRTYCAVATMIGHGKPSTEILKLAGERRSDLSDRRPRPRRGRPGGVWIDDPAGRSTGDMPGADDSAAVGSRHAIRHEFSQRRRILTSCGVVRGRWRLSEPSRGPQPQRRPRSVSCLRAAHVTAGDDGGEHHHTCRS